MASPMPLVGAVRSRGSVQRDEDGSRSAGEGGWCVAPGGGRKRYEMAVLAWMGLFVVYMLRVVMSVAVIPMQKQFDWSSAEKGLALSSFFFGYIWLQIPGGMLATQFGGKVVFGLAVAFPSLVTLLTPFAAQSFPALCVMRVLTGLGEGASYPALHALLGKWAPQSERSRMVGFIFSGAYLGTAATFPLAGLLADAGGAWGGWEWIFRYSGALGLVWAALWWWRARSSPAEEGTGEAERRYIESDLPAVYDGKGPVPWLRILSTGPLWNIVLSHTAHNATLYGLLTELPSYLVHVQKESAAEAGEQLILPFVFCFFSSVVFGRLVDFLAGNGYLSLRSARILAEGSAEVVMAASLLGAGFASHSATVVLLINVAVGMSGAGSAGYGSNHLDLSAYYAGVLMGITNTVATLPGVLVPIMAGAIVPKHPASLHQLKTAWLTVFAILSGFATLGFLVWCLCLSVTPVKGLQGPEEEYHKLPPEEEEEGAKETTDQRDHLDTLDTHHTHHTHPPHSHLPHARLPPHASQAGISIPNLTPSKDTEHH